MLKNNNRVRAIWFQASRWNTSLDTYCCIVECDDISFKKQKRLYKLAYNLTESQLAELVLLQNDHSIVV